MYNYENEYREPEFENNYEFNPQSESSFGMQNFQNEPGNGNEYETNPDFEMEGDYEYEKEFEEETEFEMNDEWQNEIRVHDHRTRPTVTVPTRPGVPAYPSRSTPYRPAPSSYRPPYRP